MKYYKTLEVYKNSTGSNVVDLVNTQAHSYGWWQYLKVIGDTVVFNNYSYSSTTSRHQRDCQQLLGWPDYIMYIETSLSLSNSDCLNDAIKALEYDIKELQAASDKPRSRKSTNEQRCIDIGKAYSKIQEIKALQRREVAS